MKKGGPEKKGGDRLAEDEGRTGGGGERTPTHPPRTPPRTPLSVFAGVPRAKSPIFGVLGGEKGKKSVVLF